MQPESATVRFEEDGENLTAVEIVRSARRPLVVPLLRALLGLGIVISTYQVRPNGSSLAERMVLHRRDGRALDAALSEQTKAILPELLDNDDSHET